MKIWKYVRKTHLYIGVTCVPLLIFYVVTGLMQVWFGTKTGNESLRMMYNLHRSQSPGKIYGQSELLVGLTIFVAVGFIVLALTGVQMAHRYSKNKWPVWICLLLGAVLPLWAVWQVYP